VNPLSGIKLAADVSRHLHASDARAPVAPESWRARYGIVSPWSTGELADYAPWADLFPDATWLGPVTRAEALSVPAMAKACLLVTAQIGRLPLRTYRDAAEIPAPTWAYSTAGQLHPGQRMSFTILDLILDGWSLWALERSPANGAVLAAEWMPYTSWDFDADGFVVNADGQKIPADRACLFRGPHDGVLTLGAATIRGARDLESAWIKAARNPIPATVLHNTTDDELTASEISELLTAWRNARRDPDGALAYLPAAVTLEEHGELVPTVLVEARNAVAVDIARLVGVPAVALDAGLLQTSLTYQNSAAITGTQLPLYGLTPYADAVSWRLSMDDITPRGTRTALDMSSVLAAVALPDQPETRD